MVLKLTIFNFPVSIVAYYRPPSSTNLNSLFNFFNNCTDSNFILLGDFNFPEIQWKSDNPVVSPTGRALARKFLSFTTQNDLTQHVNVPTHTKGNILDLLFTNFYPGPSLEDGDAGLSDHTALIFEFSFFYSRQPLVPLVLQDIFLILAKPRHPI